MKRRNALAAIPALALGSAAWAQQRPALDGPLRIVVGYAPGGSTDRVARIVGERLQQQTFRRLIWYDRCTAVTTSEQCFTRVES